MGELPEFTVDPPIALSSDCYLVKVRCGNLIYKFTGEMEKIAKAKASIFVHTKRQAHFKSLAAREARIAGRVAQAAKAAAEGLEP